MKNTTHCSCEKKIESQKNKDFKYILCDSCGKIIRIKPDMCKYYETRNRNGYCLYSEDMNNVTMICRVDGKWANCVTGTREHRL